MQIADTGGECVECSRVSVGANRSDALDSQQVIHSSRQSAASRIAIEWLHRQPPRTVHTIDIARVDSRRSEQQTPQIIDWIHALTGGYTQAEARGVREGLAAWGVNGRACGQR